MKIDYKVFSIQGIIFFLTVEIFSYFLLYLGIIPDIFSERGYKYPKHILHQGLDWRTENKPWGAWHKNNS